MSKIIGKIWKNRKKRLKRLQLSSEAQTCSKGNYGPKIADMAALY